MTLAEARKAIVERFLAVWELLDPTVPLALDNEQLRPPADGSAHARLSIRVAASGQATLAPVGSREFQRRGAVFVQIFTAVDEGTATADAYAQTAGDVFEGVSFDGLHFQAVVTRNPVPDRGTQGRYWMTVVECPFWFHETK